MHFDMLRDVSTCDVRRMLQRLAPRSNSSGGTASVEQQQ
jgi:hypothetical protein